MAEDSLPFSQRRGLTPVEAPIIIRNDAPPWLRDFIVTAAQRENLGVGDLRDMLCERLLESPDPNNWSSGNIEHEVRGLIRHAEWFHVYDFIEDVACWLKQRRTSTQFEEFSCKLNDAFRRKGIGWQLTNTRIETRGEESFESSVRTAIAVSQEMGKSVSAKELHEALLDLSKRPDPDLTGAIQHAMAGLECVVREVTGDNNGTLGELLKKNPGTLPVPLDIAASKVWGYASERARHVRENQPSNLEEAELIVGLAGNLTTYLLRKLNKDQARLD